MVLALQQLETYAERCRRLVENARKFEKGLRETPGFGAFGSPREAHRVYWRIPVRVDTARLGGVAAVRRRLEAMGCPVELKERVLIPQHNTVTDFHGASSGISFPVAERLTAETFQVRAFALYNGNAVEQVLSGFGAAARQLARCEDTAGWLGRAMIPGRFLGSPVQGGDIVESMGGTVQAEPARARREPEKDRHEFLKGIPGSGG